jgi:hypothetical protein
MSFQGALDRLVMQQVHAAEKGEGRPDETRRLLLETLELAPARDATWFLLGYARTLLGIEVPDAPAGAPARWYLYGRIRGHDRRGEREWVADLLREPNALVDLLRDPRLARASLPIVIRSLFWCGDLELAVQALGFLDAEEVEHEAIADAALTDLLSRLERRDRAALDGRIAALIERVMESPGFGRLPDDVQARYRTVLGRCRLAGSDFGPALVELQRARELAAPGSRLRGQALAYGALAHLRLHDFADLEPVPARAERAAAIEWLAELQPAGATLAPEGGFCAGILAYEAGRHPDAQRWFAAAHDGLPQLPQPNPALERRTAFFFAAAILAGGDRNETARAVQLMDQVLDEVTPDLESFYPVHEALKQVSRKTALKFLDRVDVGRGTAPDQILFVALEYLSLGEAEPAARAAQRVLQIAVDLDQRIEAMRVLVTARNMQGQRGAARDVFLEMRDLLIQRGAFEQLETLLKNEDFVGQALDHLEIRCELVALYDEMENREYEKAALQAQIARSLRARKDVESLHEALGILQEVAIRHPELAREDLDALEKLLALGGDDAPQGTGQPAAAARKALGRAPRVLVVGGNERQRRHHDRFAALAADWGFEGEWLMANYTSPQRTVQAVGERLTNSLDLLVLLHWNRHEATEPALELARKHGVLARTVHYAGFTSLQVCLADLLEKLGSAAAKAAAPKPARGATSRT